MTIAKEAYIAMNNVLVFRHQLFKVSEPFITQQSEQLSNYKPIYLGRTRFGPSPNSAISVALEDLPIQRSFHRKLWQVVTLDAKPYLKALNGRKAKLIHAHFGVEGVYALSLAKILKLPLITTFHGFDATTSVKALVNSGSPSWINYARLRNKLAQHGDIFLCVSNFIRNRVIELGFPAEKTHVHYIGIDSKSIQPRALENETPVILHVARLVEKKGTEYLIRAFTDVVKNVPEAKLTIIGDGPLKTYLSELVNSLGLNSSVTLEGAQSHESVLSHMQKSAMLVLPSVYSKTGDAEGLGMVLLEAAAYGLPLIGTNHGGIPEVVIDGETGYLVPERDSDSLSDKIISLMTNQNDRIRMGKNARSLIESQFDIHVQTKKLEAFYDEVSR